MPEESRLISLVSDESYQDWIRNQASEEENARWSNWLKANPDNQTLHQEALALYHKARFQAHRQPDIDHAWESLQTRLAKSGRQPASIRRLHAAPETTNTARSSLFRWRQHGKWLVAAVLLLALVWQITPLQKLLQRSPSPHERQTLTTEPGQRTQLRFSDGTLVILNANSSLEYARELTTTARHFQLAGEAYFEVAHLTDPMQREFTVQTADGKVRVVGTRFAVYDRGEGTRVTTAQGLVEVAAYDTSAFNPKLLAKVNVAPGHLLQFRRGQKILQPQSVDISPYTTWWQQRFELGSTTFKEIVQRLEESYDVQITVRDESLLQRKLSGAIENTGLDIIVQALGKALQVNVKQEGRIIYFGE